MTRQPTQDARPGCPPDLPIPAAGAGHSRKGQRVTTWGDEPPAGAADDSAVPAGFQGGDARAQWKAALAAHNAAGRRGRHRRAARQPGPGMIRKPPPEPPDGGDAA
jgi:hypothetical protein